MAGRRLSVIAVLAVWLAGCSDLAISNGGSGSETVFGRIVDSTGRASSATAVRLIDSGYDPSRDGSLSSALTDTTDADGLFGITGITQGVYNLEAVNIVTGTRFFRGGLTVKGKVTLAVPDTVYTPGTAVIRLPEGVSAGLVYIKGTSRSLHVDPGMAGTRLVTIDSLPRGILPPIYFIADSPSGLSLQLAPGVSIQSGAITPLLPSHFRYVSPLGSDSGDGSQLHPWLTVVKAARQALPGDTVAIMPGSYTGQVIPVRSGTPEAPIVFAGAPGTIITSSAADHLLYLSGQSHIAISGVQFVGGGFAVFNADLRDSFADGCSITGCGFVGQRYGGIWIKGHDGYYSGNSFFQCGTDDIILSDSGAPIRAVIEGNRFESGLQGVRITGNNVFIRRNRFIGKEAYAVDLHHADSVTLEGNVFVDGRSCSVWSIGSRNLSVFNNVFFLTRNASFGDSVVSYAYAAVLQAPSLIIRNNTFAGCPGMALRINDTGSSIATSGDIVNNIFYNGAIRNYFGSAVTSRIDYNCYFGPAQGSPVENGDGGIHSFSDLDPLFFDTTSYDYSLKPESPCRGIGENGADIGAPEIE